MQKGNKALMILRFFSIMYLLNAVLFSFLPPALEATFVDPSGMKRSMKWKKLCYKHFSPPARNSANEKFTGLEKLPPRSVFPNVIEIKSNGGEPSNIYCNLQFVTHFITSHDKRVFCDELPDLFLYLAVELPTVRFRIYSREKVYRWNDSIYED